MNASKQSHTDAQTASSPTQTPLPSEYDLPLVMGFVRRWAWLRYLPFSPTFRGFKFGWITKACKKKGPSN